MLCNSRALLLFSSHNHAHASKDGPEATFRQLMIKMNTNTQGTKHVKCGTDSADSEILVQVTKWVLTSIARFIANDNVDLHANLRRDVTFLTPELAGSLGTV